MKTATLLAKHLKEVHFGTNWTWSNVQDQLNDVTWEEATTKVYGLNTIAALTYHINYYVEAQLKVLDGGPLDAHDKYSYNVPEIQSKGDWDQLVDKVLSEATSLEQKIERLPESQFYETFCEEKYGTYYRNFQGVIEHTHYHLGQIAILKKIIRQQKM